MSRHKTRRVGVSICFGLALVAVGSGVSCPGGGGGTTGGGTLTPTPPPGNRPPRIIITNVSSTDVVQGASVVIGITGEDAEDAAVARVFASLVQDPTSAQELIIQGGIPFGPGQGSANVTWNTTTVPVGEYFILAEIDDRTFDPATETGNRAVRVTWTSTVSIGPNLAVGPVDISRVGFGVEGARFHGFIQRENLGTSFLKADDLDGDRNDDFMIVSRFGRPKNRPGGPGTAYLVFGRRATPFPADSDGDGVPDGFSAPPPYLPDCYAPGNVGRFGGAQSINSIGSFYRGIIYGMPLPYTSTLGLTSVTRVDMNNDATPDFVFGLPFTAAFDHIDDEPADGMCTSVTPPATTPVPVAYDHLPVNRTGDFANYVVDQLPNHGKNTAPGDQPPPIVTGSDDMGSVAQGIVIAVDGRTDVKNNPNFQNFVDAGLAGQFDPVRVQTDEGLILGPGIPNGNVPNGMRFRGGWFDILTVGSSPPVRVIDASNEYGTTVAAIPSLNPAGTGDDLGISSPGHNDSQGRVTIWLSGDYTAAGSYGVDGVRSLPGYRTCDLIPPNNGVPPVVSPTCYQEMIPGDATAMPPIPPRTDNWGCRAIVIPPTRFNLFGENAGDRLGYAGPAGQFNDDGVADLMMGAPGYPQGFNLGRVYFLFMPAGGLIHNSPISDLPRAYITGTHSGDQFGLNQTALGDMNGDGIADVVIASENFPASSAQPAVASTCNPAPPAFSSPVGAGYIGVIFGDRPLTGERGFIPEDVGTSCLEGVVFLGSAGGAHAGHSVASAGDFDGDGIGDLLISSPGKTSSVGGQTRLGVVYLIFGGPHLNRQPNEARKQFSLSQVGTAELPGIVFYGRAFKDDPVTDPIGKVNAPTLETVGGLGDIDGDGLADIAIGAPHFDFVNDPNAPTQRRIDAGETYIVYGSRRP